jgi:hypothetical protein
VKTEKDYRGKGKAMAMGRFSSITFSILSEEKGNFSYSIEKLVCYMPKKRENIKTI